MSNTHEPLEVQYDEEENIDLQNLRRPGNESDEASDNASSPITGTIAETRNIHEDFDIVTELYVKILSLRLQHKLAYVHFETLNSYFNSGLLVILAFTSGILSLVASLGGETVTKVKTDTNTTIWAPIDTKEDGNLPIQLVSEKTEELLSIIVGILSFAQVAIQNLAKMWNFDARSQMHKEVIIGLKRLLDKIEFDEKSSAKSSFRIMRVRGEKNKADESEAGLGANSIRKNNEERIEIMEQVFEQCVASCSSTLPLQIEQAFHLLRTEMTLFITLELRVLDDNYLRDMYKQACGDLQEEFSTYIFWPFLLKPPRKAVKAVIKRYRKKLQRYSGGGGSGDDNDYGFIRSLFVESDGSSEK